MLQPLLVDIELESATPPTPLDASIAPLLTADPALSALFSISCNEEVKGQVQGGQGQGQGQKEEQWKEEGGAQSEAHSEKESREEKQSIVDSGRDIPSAKKGEEQPKSTSLPRGMPPPLALSPETVRAVAKAKRMSMKIVKGLPPPPPAATSSSVAQIEGIGKGKGKGKEVAGLAPREQRTQPRNEKDIREKEEREGKKGEEEGDEKSRTNVVPSRTKLRILGSGGARVGDGAGKRGRGARQRHASDIHGEIAKVIWDFQVKLILA